MNEPLGTSDAVAKKIQAIQEEIERKNREAEKLLGYLAIQQNLAKQEEEMEEEDLKRQGIIVGQHIPSLPSKLNLDPSQLAEFETFSSTLLVAKDLITQNRINFLRRTGNLPISDLAESRKEAGKKYLSQQDPETPHYLAQTKSGKERQDRNTIRFGETIQEVRKSAEQQKTMKEAPYTSSAIKKPSTKDNKAVLSTRERIENENIIKGLQHKMNYLRNPRNNPNSVTKMLVKPKGFFNQPNAQDSPEDDNSAVSPAGTEDDDGGATSISSKIKSKYAKYIKLDNNPLFVAEPSHIYFMDYEIGTKYTKNISFKNVSAVSRSVRILPPKSKLFTISPLKYPPNCNNGIIAPGMSVSCTLTFIPENLGDYEEFIQVQTEAGSTQVQIIAQREPPNLDLPAEINLGYILVGDAQRAVFSCTNVGGFGNFTIIEDDDPEECENAEINQYNSNCLRIPPFTIYPAHFPLHKNQSIDLVFEIVPLEIGPQQRNYKILCDNGQIKSFTVMATSKEVNVSTTDINHVEFNDKDTSIYRDLYFHHLVAGAEMSQLVSIVNDTKISVEYEWVWVDVHLPTHDWTRIGQDLIVKREQLDRPFSELHGSTSEASLLILPPHNNTEAVVVDEALLRSLKETLHNENSPSAIKGNTVKEGPFEILPARGVLAGEGAAEFKFIYNPKQKDRSSLRAMMMIKSIPVAAMPNHPDQAKALQYLAQEGHGRYPRLRSWLEEMGVLGKVLPYRKPTGAISEEKKLLPLTAIINLLYTYVNEEENPAFQETEFPRINRWIRNILQHVFGLRRRDALSTSSQDGSLSAVNSSANLSRASSVDTRFSKLDEQLNDLTQTKEEERMELYDWKQSLSPYPLLIPELVLKYQEGHPSQEGEEEEDGGSDDESIVEAVETTGGVGKSLKELTPPELEMCDEIFLDIFHVIKILGSSIATLLDFRVSHEAIDYLRECSYTHVPSISFLVHGQSYAKQLVLSPPQVKIGGQVALGYEFETQVTLMNPQDSTLQLQFDKEHVTIHRKTISSLDEEIHEDFEKMLLPILNPNRKRPNEHEEEEELYTHHPASISDSSLDSLLDHLILQLSQDNFLLLPHSQERVTIRGKCLKLGHFEISIPVISADRTALMETIRIDVQVVGAKLRFNTAEVDVGLLGVGGENGYSLSFANEEDVPLMFMMKPTIHVDNLIGSPTAKKGSVVLESARGGGGGSESARSSKGGEPVSARSMRSARSTHSQMSRASSMRSEDFSIADSQATPGGDFKIELKNALLSIEPSSGTIPPHSTFTVQIITKAGKTPQRIRGMIESRIFDPEGKQELSKQFLNLRGEVQSPKVLLYPQHHNLGQVYVGRTVHFQFVLENICNLPTKFKFLRPGGASAFFQFTLDPMKGSLEAKEKVTVSGSFTSLTTGLIDDVLSCKLFGISTPLGIHLKALSKGISLEFINYKAGDPYPQPIATQEDVQYPIANEKPPEPRPIEPIFLGQAVPLYERRKATFIIRNLSAIPAPFEIAPKRFKVIEKKKRFATRGGTAEQPALGPPGGVPPAPLATLSPALAASSLLVPGDESDKERLLPHPPPAAGNSTARSQQQQSVHSVASHATISTVQSSSSQSIVSKTMIARSDLYLAPHEDGTNKFQSEAGKKYIAFELNRREDRHYLKSGLGGSYYLDIQSGILPPWSIQEVNVYAFNDIPGCYDDDLEVLIRENEVVRKFSLPVKMTVVGCPIVIEKHTMGMTEKPLSVIMSEKGEDNQKKKQGGGKEEEDSKVPLLQLGERCEHGNVLKRHFIVKNYGSKPAKVKWTIRGLAAKANGPIKFSFRYLPPEQRETAHSTATAAAVDSPRSIGSSSVTSSTKKKKAKTSSLYPAHYRIKSSFRFWEEIAKESPFQIEPLKSLLPPYEKQIFTVTLQQSSPARLEKAVLTAGILIEEQDEQGGGEKSSVLSLRRDDEGGANYILNPPEETAGTTANSIASKSAGLVPSLSTAKKPASQSFQVSLYVEGKYIHPELVINQKPYAIPYDNTLVAESEGVGLQAKSTLLFTAAPGGEGGHGAMTINPICSKLLTITNPLDSEMVVHVSTEGALLLQDYEEDKGDPSDLFAQQKKDKHHSHRTKKANSPDRSLSPEPRSHKTAAEGGEAVKKVGFEGVTPPAASAMTSARSGSIVSIKSQKNPQKEGKVLHLLPHQSTKLMIVFHPKRHLREQLMSTFGKDYGKPTQQKSFLIFSYPTGQSLRLPVITSISTPFITGSAPRLYFGTCHVQRSCQGIFLLSNPTDVPARWTLEHVPGGGQWKQSTAIRVKGFEKIPEIDDPTVFQISPMQGSVEGPTVSVAATMAAPPKDYNRREDTIVPERLVQSSWATNTLSLQDTLSNKFGNTFPPSNPNNRQTIANNNRRTAGAGGFEGDLSLLGQSTLSQNDTIHYPMPITIQFHPNKNQKYCSRFRFTCEFANSFDLVLQGEGTYEEHEHQPLNPIPRG